MIKANQKLEAVAISIKPITESPITIDFFNGEKYEGNDSVFYPGYSPVVIGSISTNPADENYISEETFEQWAIDAYYDIDAYVNKAMSVLGMFQAAPNFSAIPVITKDHMMRAIAAKIEQNLYTNPSNAEIRVTLTQNSGGRTTNMPSRENFNPSDMLNHKVQEYINGSNIFEILEDSFQAILLDRNEYYTKDEIDAIITSGEVPIERLYTLDVENYEPTEEGDGVNKKYVDFYVDDLQAQINALITGDVELKTDHVSLRNQEIESWTGLAVHQRDVNTENKIVMTQHKNKINELDKRTGVPLQAHKTAYQDVNTLTYTTIVDYDLVGNGTVDSLNGFDSTTGEYTIQEESSGDNVSIEATFKLTGKPLPSQIVGYATIQKNGATINHPVTDMPIEIPLFITTTAGATHTVAIKDVNIRREIADANEINVGDKLTLTVKQTATSIASGFPLSISNVNFDMINNKVLADKPSTSSGNTESIEVTDVVEESVSSLATTQYAINKENKVKFGQVDTKLEQVDINTANITTNTTNISTNTTDIATNAADIIELQNRPTVGLQDTLVNRDWNAATGTDTNELYQVPITELDFGTYYKYEIYVKLTFIPNDKEYVLSLTAHQLKDKILSLSDREISYTTALGTTFPNADAMFVLGDKANEDVTSSTGFIGVGIGLLADDGAGGATISDISLAAGGKITIIGYKVAGGA